MTTATRAEIDRAAAREGPTGALRFILLYGVLLFGSLWALLYPVFGLLFRPEVGFWSSLGESLLAAPFVGALWGALMLPFARARARTRPARKLE